MRAIHRIVVGISVVVLVLVTFSVRVFAGAPEDVDFAYLDSDSRDDIEVPFGLLGSCRQDGVSLFALDGVVISDVRLDGVGVEPLQIAPIYAHPGPRILIKRPGPSFRYTMKLSELQSIAPGAKEGTAFGVRKGSLPARIEITYKIRCANGALMGPFRTIGRKFSVQGPGASSGR